MTESHKVSRYPMTSVVTSSLAPLLEDLQQGLFSEDETELIMAFHADIVHAAFNLHEDLLSVKNHPKAHEAFLKGMAPAESAYKAFDAVLRRINDLVHVIHELKEKDRSECPASVRPDQRCERGKL